ncbi:putative beta-carotene-binding protein [Schistocerca gregaria]|uniref:putative beta-carotene-binding protein n=1 Tax=Schistocerca gregaria TaxID=7010 RepID=UPI00211F42E1|nr:putative beta-carotene-binding protein [Schistocerca gregaria]
MRTATIIALVAASIAAAVDAGAYFAPAALSAPASGLGVKVCADDQPDVAICRKNALQQAIPMLAHGIPSIGASPIDPLDNLPPLVFNVNQPGITINFELKNSRMLGHGRAVLEDLNVDTNAVTIRVLTHVPGEFIFDGDHTIDAYVFGVPYKGSGRFTLVEIDSGVEMIYSGHPVPGPDGRTYLQLTSGECKLDYGATTYKLTGVYGDYPPFVEALGKFITEVTSPVVEKLIAPPVEAWMADIYRSRAQQVFSTVPFDVIFPKTLAIDGFYRAFYPHY